jgi:hypothetical protein
MGNNMIRIEVENLSDVQRIFIEADKKLQRSAVSAVNATAKQVKEQLFVLPIVLGTGLAAELVKSRIRIKNATIDNPEATLTPSSYGIAVSQYRYMPERVGERATVARIRIQWIDGLKTAAGFINPRGKLAMPLRSRNHKKKKLDPPQEALGPSIASAFKQLSDDELRRKASDMLREKFQRFIERNYIESGS